MGEAIAVSVVVIVAIGATGWAAWAEVDRRRWRSEARRLKIDHGQIARAVLNARAILQRLVEGTVTPRAAADALSAITSIAPEVEGTPARCGCGRPWAPGDAWCAGCGAPRPLQDALGPARGPS